MGRQFAADISQSEIPLEAQLEFHLRVNHFPPVPASMVQVCVQAIEAYWDNDSDRLIKLPEGVGYKGLTAAPAWAVCEAHHLGAWTWEYDYDEVNG